MSTISLDPKNVAAVTSHGAAVIDKLASALTDVLAENAELKSKLNARDNDDKVRKIASDMEEKGLNAHLDFDEKVASIQEHLKTAGTLDAVEQAVEMAATGQVSFGKVDDDEIGSGVGDNTLISFCLGRD